MTRQLAFFVFIILVIIGCGSKMNNSKSIDELIATDQEFSDLSQKEGVPVAFDRFMDDDAVMYRNKQVPVIGREAIRKLFDGYPDASLTWEPFKTEVGSGGDLGYTLGKWTFTAGTEQDGIPVGYGFYVTIWKKQPDGNWKYVFDTGINAPAGYKPY